MASIDRTIVIVGTGGTAAGTAPSATDNVGLQPPCRSSPLLVAVSPLAALPIEGRQVAQLDGNDMTHAVPG